MTGRGPMTLAILPVKRFALAAVLASLVGCSGGGLSPVAESGRGVAPAVAAELRVEWVNLLVTFKAQIARSGGRCQIAIERSSEFMALGQAEVRQRQVECGCVAPTQPLPLRRIVVEMNDGEEVARFVESMRALVGRGYGTFHLQYPAIVDDEALFGGEVRLVVLDGARKQVVQLSRTRLSSDGSFEYVGDALGAGADRSLEEWSHALGYVSNFLAQAVGRAAREVQSSGNIEGPDLDGFVRGFLPCIVSPTQVKPGMGVDERCSRLGP